MKLRMAVAALLFCILTVLPATSADTIASPQADQQLKAMENKFFEHDFSKEPEEYRVQRLEKFAFGQSGTGGVDQRLVRLAKIIDTHKNLVAQTAQPQTKYSRQLDDNQSQQSAHDKMKWVEDYRPRPASAYAEPMQSVVSEEQRMQNEERELEQTLFPTPRTPNDVLLISRNNANGAPTEAQPAQAEDPVALGDAPPNRNARMLTRVAWCEQHVFGQTFPQLHLPARLHHLAAELLPNEHPNDLELMDRLDLMVREVVMQQHPPIAYKP
jgi:hypothetical protein